ncbi:beta-mannase [Coprinopsis cinerea okayama7|uniref:mannan endo-1,4-beta-mannosidase n=1 Tax=Coprinopsis cinerea (strain Okayama-7 / 130 / ATCC MYA-4618 / FGSC 9003) TaxID=240176 RepID=A8NFG6_COPC7|nr:beta-mannase [Coprinopsis cinerea okayama7\|eukprot:XP_001833278.2 beta-mannase [Coprinopsis cinerea okayama7\
MFVAALWPVALGALAVLATAKPTRTSPLAKRQAPSDIRFVTTDNGRFVVNGAPINFVGTNAYWLHTLNSEQDIDYTLGNISAAGIKIVRTWAFNEVTSVPETGTWFQLIKDDGTVEINEGPNGLQKLDAVVRLAEKHNIYLLLALTNNWSPDPLFDDITIGAGPVRRSDITPPANGSLPRNFLSNDYGGMDTYVRQFGLDNHDEFYTNPKVINAFKNFTATIAKRYTNSPAVFGWELANDARCSSTVGATTCNPKVITKWHSNIAQHIKEVDPNHLVASGIIQDRLAARKRNMKRNKTKGGVKIRGRWTSSDILNIPEISFSSFQLFPDQNEYGQPDPDLSDFENTMQRGVEWIQYHAESALAFGKPATLNGFGLVTQEHVPNYVPFNSSEAPYASDKEQPYGVTNEQRDEAFSTWLNVGFRSGLSSMIHYQWGQTGLTVQPGTTVSQSVPGTGLVENDGITGVSPNDGYSSNGVGRDSVIEVLQESVQEYASDSTLR